MLHRLLTILLAILFYLSPSIVFSIVPFIEDGTELALHATYLYTHVSEDGLTLVTRPNSTNSPLGSFNTNGMKLGAIIKQTDYNYDMALNYTWVYGSAEQSLSGNDLIAASDINNSYYRKKRVTQANGIFNFHFNSLQLELGTTIPLKNRVKLRPHTGFVLLWNDENIDYTYDLTERMKQKQNVRGIGIRIGKEMNIALGSHFSLYGAVATSLLWTQYKIDRNDTNATVTTFKAKDFFHTVMPSLEGSIGIEYGRFFADEKLYFAIRLSADEEVWINHNKFLMFYQDIPNGNLTLAGIGLRAEISF